MSSFITKALSFSALSALLGFFGLFSVTALSGLAAGGFFGFILAALVSGVAITAYYTVLDTVVHRGLLGSRIAAADHTLPFSVISTLVLFVAGSALHLLSVGGLFAGLISAAACVAVDRYTDSSTKKIGK